METGRLLLEAKRKLKHGDFQPMIEDELPFGARTAEMLMVIASHEVIRNAKYISYLPASWATLYELAALSPDRLRALIADGTVNAKMTREDARALLPGIAQDRTAPRLSRGITALLHVGIQLGGVGAVRAYMRDLPEDARELTPDEIEEAAQFLRQLAQQRRAKAA